MPQPKVGTRIRFAERRNHPQVLDGLGTHSGTKPERAGAPLAEIRHIRVPAIDRAFDSDNGKQVLSVYSGSNPDRLPKRAPASTDIPVGLTECAETSNGRFSDTAVHGLCVPEGQLVSSGQPDQGLTIIEKFEAYANQVAFAVVLLTPDDVGGAALAPSQASRARQNVIFELGYFAGKLGRGRACLLRKGDVEIPSDLYGVIYTNMDADEGWKLKLAKELKAAGLKFDGDKVF
jgi:hypothetical protein